jgi:hypothetical protein
MLGQLLEFSMTAHPIAPALEFCHALGFEDLQTGDFLVTPHAALWDGTMSLGLHDREFDSPALTFVRPQLSEHLRGLRHLGIELEYAQLADDEFNQAGFLDPNRQLIVLVEARTFSPAVWDTERVAACGTFLEYSLATHSIEESQTFWERLGLTVIASGDAPHDWVRMQGHGLVLGLHQSTAFHTALSFKAPNLDARVEYLQAKGLQLRRGTALSLGRRESATLLGPMETPIFLFGESDH